jgi:hypothetical protein
MVARRVKGDDTEGNVDHFGSFHCAADGDKVKEILHVPTIFTMHDEVKLKIKKKEENKRRQSCGGG